jgi:hypothetical protein
MNSMDVQNIYNRWKFLENDSMKKNRFIHLLKRIKNLAIIIEERGDEVQLNQNGLLIKIDITKELEVSINIPLE